jgi:hypothetical protein
MEKRRVSFAEMYAMLEKNGVKYWFGTNGGVQQIALDDIPKAIHLSRWKPVRLSD